MQALDKCGKGCVGGTKEDGGNGNEVHSASNYSQNLRVVHPFSIPIVGLGLISTFNTILLNTIYNAYFFKKRDSIMKYGTFLRIYTKEHFRRFLIRCFVF